MEEHPPPSVSGAGVSSAALDLPAEYAPPRRLALPGAQPQPDHGWVTLPRHVWPVIGMHLPAWWEHPHTRAVSGVWARSAITAAAACGGALGLIGFLFLYVLFGASGARRVSSWSPKASSKSEPPSGSRGSRLQTQVFCTKGDALVSCV